MTEETSYRKRSDFRNRNTEQVKKLPTNRTAALLDLHINPTHRLGKDESPVFLLYLNYAVNNIRDITGIDPNLNDETKVANSIKEKGTDTIRKLANFFWLFNVDNPMQDFPDYEKKTLLIAEKIYALRNYFAHLNESGVAPLLVNRDVFVFLAGILLVQARNHAVQPGLRTAKLFKMSLLAMHEKDACAKEANTYEFTRKGLIFFICLALYRDDAIEFTQCLEDMKLPVCPRGRDLSEECDSECACMNVCKPAVAKAFIAMFTYFSARRGRSVNLLADDSYYMKFADLVGYLNKVPPAAMNYLTLSDEKDKLRKLADASTESDENKEFKYSLHTRFRDRFLSFAAAFCEDFDVFPSMRFKRLDISDAPGRKRYFFGKENDNAVRMDRHFQIHDDAIRFEFVPDTHYGPIHIGALRSSVSSSTMKQLIWSHFNSGNSVVENAIKKYFTAYHRILETLVNIDDPDDIYLEDNSFLQDFATVSNLPSESISSDMSSLESFFPKNLIRYFTGEKSLPNKEELFSALENRLCIMKAHANDFLTRREKHDQWLNKLSKKKKKNPQAKLPRPVCNSAEVKYPPRTCEFSDGILIEWVFRYLNLFLTNDKKFRQLPLGKQHRGGVVDHEYQLLHSIIGKYSLEPQELSRYIGKNRPELLVHIEKMNRCITRLKKEAAKKRPPKFNLSGKLILPPPTLSMLAAAAAQCYLEFCEQELEFIRSDSNIDSKLLVKKCRKFGVRTGLPFNRESLLKTILRLDLGKWLNAFDYQSGEKYDSRSLDQTEHIVSQVPFPANFADRIMSTATKSAWSDLIRCEDGKTPSFDFNAAFRRWKTAILPREFYDTKPIIEALRVVKVGRTPSGIIGFNSYSEKPEFPLDLSKNALDKAIRIIKDTANQDKILLHIALCYWNKFQANGSFVCAKKKNDVHETSVYTFFDADVTIKFKKGNCTIRIAPNDINKPILSQIHEYAPQIAQVMNPDGSQSEFDFYEMLKTYRSIQATDRKIRLELIPLIRNFDERISIPSEKYRGKTPEKKRSMEFEEYHKIFPSLKFEQYEKIVTLRNLVFHRGIHLDPVEGLNLLNSFIKHSV